MFTIMEVTASTIVLHQSTGAALQKNSWSRFDNPYGVDVTVVENQTKEAVKEHYDYVWLPWGCQMRLFARSTADHRNFVECIAPTHGNTVYWIGDSHMREMFLTFLGGSRPENFHYNKSVWHHTRITVDRGDGRMIFIPQNDVCDWEALFTLAKIHDEIQKRKGLSRASLIVLSLGSWAAVRMPRHRRSLADVQKCFSYYVEHLAKLQAMGVSVRVETPVAHCCRTDAFKSYSHKNHQLVARAIKAAAQQHGIPVWDKHRISCGMEPDIDDTCNHYNTQMYDVLLQVLCQSLI